MTYTTMDGQQIHNEKKLLDEQEIKRIHEPRNRPKPKKL
jgi:hypothetical protein